MNGRQAARAAAKKIEEMNVTLGFNRLDIVDYNRCILHMIGGGSPCDFCEDIEECQLEEKGKKGCGEWMLRRQITPLDVNEGDEDASKGIFGAGQEG